jgi:hypothetical protein
MNNAALHRALATLRRAGLFGKISACFFVLTFLLMLDGLQALMRDDFNSIDLPLGGQAPISGAMPLQAKKHEDIVASIEGLDGLSFTPLTDFRGLWFGVHMWRATLDASAVTEAGRAVLTITDIVPAKSTTSNATIMVQNPNQIYTITVWPSEEAMRASHFSLCRRLTGLSAFIWAGLGLTCAFASAAWHVFVNQAAHRALAELGVFVIHGMQKTDAGHVAIFSQCDRKDLQAQQPMFLVSPAGKEQGKGVLIACAPHKHRALFPLDGVPPRYGWLLRYEPHHEA